MKSSKAPEGFYTYAYISVLLMQGTSVRYHWDTPIGLAQAASKALGWAKEEMSKERIRGRSQIRAFTVKVELRPGEFQEAGDQK